MINSTAPLRVLAVHRPPLVFADKVRWAGSMWRCMQCDGVGRWVSWLLLVGAAADVLVLVLLLMCCCSAPLLLQEGLFTGFLVDLLPALLRQAKVEVAYNIFNFTVSSSTLA